MAEWSHTICERCWIKDNITFFDEEEAFSIKMPVRILKPQPEFCCFCHHVTIFGVYVRHDPSYLDCNHEPEEMYEERELHEEDLPASRTTDDDSLLD